MLRASIVIPIHNHHATLLYSLQSIQAQVQGLDDIEILIIGDGVDDTLRATVRALQAGDARIRFFDMPKGPRRGELNRDQVLRTQAQGRIVCYACDDDLWLPDHLQSMETALDDADFVGCMHAVVFPDDRIRGYFFDVNTPAFYEPWLEWKFNKLGAWANDGFGLSNGAHRLEAYFRLPVGWATTPDGLPTDNFMWQKFKREPWCRTKFLPFPLSLAFPPSERAGWTQEQCAEELARWSATLAAPNGSMHVMRGLLADLGERLLEESLKNIRERNELAALRDRLIEEKRAPTNANVNPNAP